MQPTRYAPAQLDLRLAALNRACRAAASRQQLEAAQLDRPDLAGYCITDREAAVLLDRAERFVTAPVRAAVEPAMRAVDLAAEAELRALAEGDGARLPLDQLSAAFDLTELDRQALVAAAAPELDRAYERIYAYLCDDATRRQVSVELLMALTDGLEDRHRQRLALGPYGTLRRCRLLVEQGDAVTDLRQQLRLGRGLLELLLGAPVDVASIGGDPGTVAVTGVAADVSCQPHTLDQLAAALGAGTVDAVQVWGRRDLADAAALGLGATLAVPLRQVRFPTGGDPELLERELREAAVAAATTGALLWLSLEPLDDGPAGLLDTAAATLDGLSQPLVVTSAAPWRPARVLARRRWVETRAVEADLTRRAGGWRSRHPELTEHEAVDLAARFRLDPAGAAAASRLARTEAALDGGPPASFGTLERACAAVSTPRPDRLVTVVEPRRGPDDLILPAALHQQVTEIAGFARSLPALADRWGGDRPVLAPRGLKALFVGDPGTGKTLAAEVIATLLRVQLVKVDLSRVVSKWVGETAKHLDTVFRLADGSSAVLFFDEADALFGRRGEVRHGTDRYANTEVSHLLQRFEEHPGLVILASNLQDQIDPAFSRRFHTVLHFPRPEEPERRRLWDLVLPPPNGTPGGIDLTALAALDLTGAGIVGSARTAALLAAAEGAGRPTMAHLASGVARQFRSEGRLAPPDDLAALTDLAGSVP
jgi:hypothetical protein